ncbi:RNA-binding domain-containing protein [Perkinsela sp. CCAP 1560/4]|nr:RNA-binding domain-containing protein [Perkinsela sp. CCAP 1560/4]|eukprot:KNH03928.1 RNA-binding domain-containing protein [Perkinsela sp. CCAP 1560/4]
MTGGEIITNSNVVYVGNIDQRVDECLLYELMVQVGPVISVSRFPRETDNDPMNKDAVFDPSNRYAFVQFKTPIDAQYCCLILNNCRLYDLPIKVAPANPSATLHEITENIKNTMASATSVIEPHAVYGIHISNIDDTVDEEKLSETFRSFGHMISFPQIFRSDPFEESEATTNTALIYYNTKEEANEAINAMNGQHYFDRVLRVEASRR